jgi:four helix bundle protein
MREYGFEKLKVWQESRELTKTIYQITADFPDSERYGLISQIRRAAISVGSNIAEGSGRRGAKEQQQFYRMAYSSLMELLSQLILASDLEYLKEERLNSELRPRIESISSKLYSLRKAN